MLGFLHLAPGADWVVVFMAVAGGFALYIGITIILEDFGRDVHNLIKAYKEEKASKIGNWRAVEIDTHSKDQE